MRQSPLVFDLDNDGLDLISVENSTAFFDLDNDGFVERVGWVGADDALLVRDLDGNGYIETRNELFGGSPSDGFASLRLLDTNADNVMNASDAAFAELKVWRDLNGNGVSEAGELQSLTAAGIASISLASVHLTTPQTIAGNSVTDTSTFTWTAGGTGLVADVWFSINQAFSFDARPVEIVPEALFLPTLRGYGIISSLTAQMSRDPTLLGLVQDFVETPITAVSDQQIIDIMYRWAGVDGIAPGSRTVFGATIDSRKIVFLERFLNDAFTQDTYGSNASPTAVPDLEAAFGAVFDAVKLRLVAQAQFSEVFGLGAFDYLSDSLDAVDLEASLGRAADAALALPGGFTEKLDWWRAAAPIFQGVADEQAVSSGDLDSWLHVATGTSIGFAFSAAELPRPLVVGTTAAEALTGTVGAEILRGDTGNDTLSGAAGDDLYLFARGDGQDRIIETGGAVDAILFAAGILPGEVSLSRAGTNLDDLVISIAGGDQVTAQAYFARSTNGTYNGRIEAIRFADGISWDYATIVALVTTGSAAADLLIGEQSGNPINGLDGSDTIEGRDGNDTLQGGAGSDRLLAGKGDDVANGGDWSDTIDGGADHDLLQGGDGADSIFGGADLIAGSGNDTIVGGLGNDTLNGGNRDSLYLFARGDGVDRIIESGGVSDGISFAAGVLPSEVSLSRAGGNFDDLVISIAGVDQITAHGYFTRDAFGTYVSRIEEISFADGTAWDYAAVFSRVISVTAGSDRLIGDHAANAFDGLGGNDTIEGRDGNDTLDGGTGTDRLDGGTGDDLYFVDASTDVVLEGFGWGSDEVRATAASFTLGIHIERLTYVGSGNFAGTGNSTAETISGGAGSDTLFGGNGDDVLVGDSGADRLDGGSGYDRVEYAGSTSGVNLNLASGVGSGGDAAGDTVIAIENIVGSAFGDALTGDSGANHLAGSDGNDTLLGGAHADSLEGGQGADSFEGGSGADYLRGGDGRDVATYAAAAAAITINLVMGVGTGSDADGDTLTEIENIIATAFADRVSGDTVDNSLGGGGGDDTLTGDAGADTLAGGSGSDSIVGGDGDDYISFAGSTVGVTLNLTTGAASGDGVDTVSQVEHALGSGFADSLFGSPAGNYLDGAAGNDSIRGNGANDTLVGGVGDDILQGGGGLDLLLGGAGRDLVTYNAETDGVTVNLTTGQASRASGTEDTIQDVEDLRGTNANDSLLGTAGANEIEGVNGDDTLVGLGGADTFWGGNGFDYVVYASASSGALVNLATNVSGGAAAGSRFSLIEGVVGSAFGDTIVGSSVDDVVQGGAGADSLDGGAGLDWLDYATSTAAITVNLTTAAASGGDAQGDTILGFEAVIGGAANDAMTGTAGTNILQAGAGNDVLAGNAGADTLLGDAGVDQLNGGADADYIDGGADADWAMYNTATAGVHVNLALGTGLAGEALGDVLVNIEQIVGTAYSDTLIGDAGDNALRANAGGDSLNGGAGIDLLDYSTSAAGVTVNLATGSTSGGDAQGDTIANFENVGGGSAADALTGNGDANVLQGNGGNDTLVGGGGDDTLNGTAGTDRLTGGTGADRFRWTLSTDTGLDSAADVVTDFLSSDADRIDLSFIDPNSALAGNQAFSFIGTATFAAGVRGQLRYENTGGNTWIEADLDGNQVAEFEIMLTGSKTLTASDFLL
jgi:Ca2+-binding RTX toxin-like protein